MLDKFEKAISTTTTALQLARSGGDVTDVIQTLNEEIQGLRGDALQIRSENLELREKCVQLQQELENQSRFSEWKETVERLVFPNRATVYHEPRTEGVTPYYCAQCYLRGETGLLRPDYRSAAHDKYTCLNCNTEILLPPTGNPGPPAPSFEPEY